MANYDFRTAQKLAVDIRSAHGAIDAALADLAALTCSVIDTCRSSDAPPSETQAAIEKITSGLVKMVDARNGFVSAHREIAIAHSKSNLNETNFGCVGSGPLTTPAGLRVVGS